MQQDERLLHEGGMVERACCMHQLLHAPAAGARCRCMLRVSAACAGCMMLEALSRSCDNTCSWHMRGDRSPRRTSPLGAGSGSSWGSSSSRSTACSGIAGAHSQAATRGVSGLLLHGRQQQCMYVCKATERHMGC